MYEIRAYVSNGYWAYSVDSIQAACDHAEQIIMRGHVRMPINEDKLTFIPVYKVSVVGEGVGKTEYPAEFRRT